MANILPVQCARTSLDGLNVEEHLKCSGWDIAGSCQCPCHRIDWMIEKRRVMAEQTLTREEFQFQFRYMNGFAEAREEFVKQLENSMLNDGKSTVVGVDLAAPGSSDLSAVVLNYEAITDIAKKYLESQRFVVDKSLQSKAEDSLARVAEEMKKTAAQRKAQAQENTTVRVESQEQPQAILEQQLEDLKKQLNEKLRAGSFGGVSEVQLMRKRIDETSEKLNAMRSRKEDQFIRWAGFIAADRPYAADGPYLGISRDGIGPTPPQRGVFEAGVFEISGAQTSSSICICGHDREDEHAGGRGACSECKCSGFRGAPIQEAASTCVECKSLIEIGEPVMMTALGIRHQDCSRRKLGKTKTQAQEVPIVSIDTPRRKFRADC